mmetsp:Transcript_21428/g.69161  ORF Transcript_21428/g.69161 Transcript_21428/m.69161 type:complete len:264 (+) Transcript_21428:474-1265(+)
MPPGGPGSRGAVGRLRGLSRCGTLRLGCAPRRMMPRPRCRPVSFITAAGPARMSSRARSNIIDASSPSGGERSSILPLLLSCRRLALAPPPPARCPSHPAAPMWQVEPFSGSAGSAAMGRAHGFPARQLSPCWWRPHHSETRRFAAATPPQHAWVVHVHCHAGMFMRMHASRRHTCQTSNLLFLPPSFLPRRLLGRRVSRLVAYTSSTPTTNQRNCLTSSRRQQLELRLPGAPSFVQGDGSSPTFKALLLGHASVPLCAWGAI